MASGTRGRTLREDEEGGWCSCHSSGGTGAAGVTGSRTGVTGQCPVQLAPLTPTSAPDLRASGSPKRAGHRLPCLSPAPSPSVTACLVPGPVMGSSGTWQRAWPWPCPPWSPGEQAGPPTSVSATSLLVSGWAWPVLGLWPGSGAAPSSCFSWPFPSAPSGGLRGVPCGTAPSSGSFSSWLFTPSSSTLVGSSTCSAAGVSTEGLPSSASEPGAAGGSLASPRPPGVAPSGAGPFSSGFSVQLAVLLRGRSSRGPGLLLPSFPAAPWPFGGNTSSPSSSRAPFSCGDAAARKSPSSPQSDWDLRNLREGGRLLMEPLVRTCEKAFGRVTPNP